MGAPSELAPPDTRVTLYQLDKGRYLRVPPGYACKLQALTLERARLPHVSEAERKAHELRRARILRWKARAHRELQRRPLEEYKRTLRFRAEIVRRDLRRLSRDLDGHPERRRVTVSARTPRGRRLRLARSSRGSPGRKPRKPDPDPLARLRRGRVCVGVVV